MLMTVGDFRARVRAHLQDLIEELKACTVRSSKAEEEAWRSSLRQLASVLDETVSPDLCLHLKGRGHVELEYVIPGSNWGADAVLLGAHKGRAAAVFLELKNWDIRTDRPGRGEGLITRDGEQELHPSAQVQGYTEYCQHFHSAVQESSALCYGCVILTGTDALAPYVAAPNAELTRRYPLFTDSLSDRQRLATFLNERLTEPHPAFAEAFSNGYYRQNRSVIQQLAEQIRNAHAKPFVLLGPQQLALARCLVAVRDAVRSWKTNGLRRKVIVIHGPPGSGKSAIAARLWAEVSLMDDVGTGDIMFVTTTASQNSNWSAVFGQVRKEEIGMRGAVRGANIFYPLSTKRAAEVNRICGPKSAGSAMRWRKNLQLLRDANIRFQDGARDMGALVSIVDEAHALIDPVREGGKGTFGFLLGLGPQAYHIMRGSALTVFLLDSKQGFRVRENTQLEDISKWAKEDLGADEVDVVSLEGLQFRCGGSGPYVDWVENLLSNKSVETNQVYAAGWYVPPESGASGNVIPLPDRAARSRVATRQPFKFRLFPSPFELEAALRERIQEGNTARLASSFARKWKTKGDQTPHDLLPEQLDFCEHIEGYPTPWSRPWNVVRDRQDYTWFVQGAPGSRIAVDPLAEVGCPYALRNFDYDYLGVLWPEDLVRRNGRWHVDVKYVKESGLNGLIGPARKELKSKKYGGEYGPKTQELIQRIWQAYRILFTRGLKGIYVWIKDEETRKHVRESLRTSER